ncbi:MAG: hypothetical protein ABSE86_31820 [Bryobacteraceae bacterium]
MTSDSSLDGGLCLKRELPVLIERSVRWPKVAYQQCAAAGWVTALHSKHGIIDRYRRQIFAAIR